MEELVEHRSRKAARILDSTRELVLDHGAGKVTVAEITRAAGVGKGTVYLYWPTKEDLILGLFAREVLAVTDTIIGRVTADPAVVLPHRLAPLLIRSALEFPLASCLHTGDTELLRLLALEGDERELFARTEPSAMAAAVVPILYRHGLIRDDRSCAEQAYTLHALTTGFSVVLPDSATSPVRVDDPDALLADVVSRLVEPPEVSPEACIAAAAEVVVVLRETREAVLQLIQRSGQ